MFNLDQWQEILTTLIKNPLRAALTGISVMWGIFILIILLGSGRGLQNGVEYQFRDDAINSIFVRNGQTSLPFRGIQPGRSIQFTNEDFSEIRAGVEGVEHITGRLWLRGPITVNYGKEYGSFDVRCVHPGHRYLENTEVVAGRYLNEYDLRDFRKVAVIGEVVRQDLFKERDPLGEYLNINNIPFQVVGVFKDEGSEDEMRLIYLPISTAQRTFSGQNLMNMILLTTGEASLPESQRMAEDLTQRIARRHSFDPADERAIYVRNNVEQYERFQGLIRGIRSFVWVIGVMSLLAGVIGVSNIMLIVVQERTREIGVRKALGASPASVVGLILQESVFLTTLAGFSGLAAGMLTLDLAGRWLKEAFPDFDFFVNPSVDLSVAVQATVLLVLAGALAGLAPALRAARIRPVEALRAE
jgi:putative ABC transport system permease protein